MRFAIDPDNMLAKCERLQWSVGEIEWDAPGADVITSEDRAALGGSQLINQHLQDHSRAQQTFGL